MILTAILVIFLLHLMWRFVTMLMPVLVVAAVIVAGIWLVKKMICCRRTDGYHDWGEVRRSRRAHSCLDRIERRIEALETLMAGRRERGQG